MLRRTLLSGFVALTLAIGLAPAPSQGAPAPAAAAAIPSSASVASAAALRAKKSWKPAPGAAFNNPLGSIGEKTKLMSRIVAAINHTPKGEYIRIAAYSFDRQSVLDALLKAHRRGVHVQMLLNDNWTSKQTLRLQKVLGKKAGRKSFVRICKGSCRGGPGNLHLKVYSFSKTGAATDVIMTGSHNMTDRAVRLQWNDLYTINGNKTIYDTFKKVFNQMKWDKRVSPRWVYFHSGDYSGQYYKTTTGPTKADAVGDITSTVATKIPGPDKDPVMKRLKEIRCKALPGTGKNGHTVIRIVMYGWNQERGKWLAEQMSDLKRRKCNISIVASAMGGAVLKILRQRKIDVRSADWDFPPVNPNDPKAVRRANFYSHLKILAVNGNMSGKPVKTVWTGSENWSGISFLNDELILEIDRARVYRKYVDQFNFIRRRATHSFATKPLGMP
ncbi:phospholipase D-like domain-containing protein [Nocardioides sp.]|uniref:phospholipase D-like domain-containing protein n=1 Tax=Nocardioides sp. TaxID=35761 RepID=UPI003529C09D